MLFRMILLISIMALLVAACGSPAQQTPAEDKSVDKTETPMPATPTPTEPVETQPSEGPQYAPLEPLPDEGEMIRGGISIRTSEIILMESFPVQVQLRVSGVLPTPCHMPRAEVTGPDEDGNIYVEMWTLTDTDAVCIQVLQPFETSIPLGSYESGSFTVFLNDKEVGDFSL